MATRADIEVNVKGLKKVQELSKLLDKVSGKVNQLNQGAGSAAKNNKLEKESLKLQEDKRASMVRVRNVGDKIAVAKERGFKVDKASRALNRAALSNSQGKFKLARAQANAANNLLKTEIAITKEDAKQLRFEKLLASIRGSGARGGARPPGRGGGGFGGALSSAAISGAFPLLFGQGPAAAGGGFAGGLIGSAFGPMGGFAGGLIGTASVTKFQEEVVALGQALDPINGDIQKATDKLGFLSKTRKAEILLIEKVQGKQAALNAVTKDMADVVGEEGVTALREMAEAADRFANKFGNAMLKFKVFVANTVKDISERIRPGGFELDKAISIVGKEDPSVTALNETTKQLKNLEAGLGDKSFFRNLTFSEATGQKDVDRVGVGPGGGSKALTEAGIAEKERLEAIKKSQTQTVKLNAESKFGAKISKDASNELNEVVSLKFKEFETQKAINKLRTDEGFTKSIAQEVFAIKEAAKERKNIIANQIIEAQNKLKNNDLDKENKILLEERITSLKDQQKINDNLLNQDVKKIANQRELTNAATETLDAFQNINTTIQNDIKQGIAGLIKGTSTLSDLLNNVADRFLDIALNQGLFGNAGGKTITGGLFKMLGFADGGRPPVNRPSIVGEKGPELFVPRSSGNIIPNNKLGGGGTTSVVVNVDASGSDVQGDEAAAKEIGTLISVAVQGELLKQQRPGGLLSR